MISYCFRKAMGSLRLNGGTVIVSNSSWRRKYGYNSLFVGSSRCILPKHICIRQSPSLSFATRRPAVVGHPSPRALQQVRESSNYITDVEDYEEVFYDPQRNAEYWSTRPVLVTKRTLQIGARFARWLLETRFENRRSATKDLTSIRAEKLKDVLVDLGPAFVKIGQAVSARPDVVPPVYLNQLEKLQDQIPPFDNDEAMRILEAEMKLPAYAMFSELSESTVAAASLGQVYKARLRSTGELVAIKIQRPGVAAAIGLDTYILRWLAEVIRRWRRLNTNLPALLDEWATSLFKELDYTIEASNGLRFKELYSQLEGVHVPHMFLQHTTRKVLVMEWVEGERLRTGTKGYGSLGSIDDLALVDVGVRCSLEQMLEEGFYHADPHPGNLMRTKDGKLAYLDFGMMGQIDGTIRRGLIRATLHLINREYPSLADDFITLGFLPAGADKADIVPALTGVFQQALAGGVSNLSFGDLSSNLGQTMYQYNFQIPPYYTLLVRSLSVLEGIALGSDPNYKVLRAAYPWVARRLLSDTAPELRDTLLALLYKDGKFQFNRMESLLTEAAKSPARGDPKGGASSGGGRRSGDALGLMLSPTGAFLREVMVEELAKGVDAAWRVGLDSVVDAAMHKLKAVVTVDQPQRPEAGGPLSRVVARQLLDALTAMPALSGSEDRVQLDGIAKIVAALEADSAVDTVGMSDSARAIAQSTALLQWLLKEAQALDAEQRAEALRIPLVLSAKVSSRVAARTIRLLLNPRSLNGTPAVPQMPVSRANGTSAKRPVENITSASQPSSTQASASRRNGTVVVQEKEETIEMRPMRVETASPNGVNQAITVEEDRLLIAETSSPTR